MDTPGAELPKSRLWTANYTRAWVANFLLFFSFMVMTPLFPVYLSAEFGADKDTIGWVLAGYSITAVLARFVSGWLVDSFPRMVVLVSSFVLFALCTGAYLLTGSLRLLRWCVRCMAFLSVRLRWRTVRRRWIRCRSAAGQRVSGFMG